jgi:hypothetical protein
MDSEKLLHIEQHSQQWFQSRLGNCTGSRVKDALFMLKRASSGRVAGDSSQARIDYMMELCLGRLTGIVPEHFVTQAMQWGIDNELYAVAAYEVVSGNDTSKIGIAAHPRIERFLASADRYVNDSGVLEVKCPTSPVHIAYLKGGVIPVEYEYQCMAELACDPTREWLDFMSFDPRFPPKLQTFLAPRMYRSEWAMKIAEMEDGVRKFLAETATLTAELQELAEKRVL